MNMLCKIAITCALGYGLWYTYGRDGQGVLDQIVETKVSQSTKALNGNRA